MQAQPFNWQRCLREDRGWLHAELWNPMAQAWQPVPGHDRWPVEYRAAAEEQIAAQNAQQQATNAEPIPGF
jgi:hypothetical protein